MKLTVNPEYNSVSANLKYQNYGHRISESFCILPWVHLHTWPNGNVFPCCLYNSEYPIGNVGKNTLRELWNSDVLKNLRKEMLENKNPDSCKRCRMQEEMGSYSTRYSSNYRWRDRIDEAIKNTDSDGYSHDFKLLYWDFRFSNVCNFRCRSCGPELSSGWYDDQIKMWGSSTTPKALVHVNDNSVEDIFTYVNEFIGEVEEIYFAGGESLLMDEHYLILEKLIEVGNTKCRIKYNTNFSKLKFKNWNVIDLWNQFPKENIEIYASLDAIGPIAEYVRKGTNWEVIEENIRLVQENGIKVFISSTISLLTIFEMPKFIDRMLELGIIIDDFLFHNVLTFPDYYCISIIPDDLKEKLINVLDEHSNSIVDPYIKSIIIENYDVFKKYLDMKPERDIDQILFDFKNCTNVKDKYRKESFVELYPYYKEWFESIKNKTI
jgi:radical SAM protein with 4Fe4S-binding SPASM domain